MATIDGKPVFGAGIIQFLGTERADTETTPPLRFRSSTTYATGVSAEADGLGFVLNINLAPGNNFCGFFNANVGTFAYRIVYSVERVAELEAGAFYEARYTISNQ